ncbi:MAG TPA: hypothetical protein VLE73_03945 [Candidatus Saccharimonadales bacterium]|nr:hypothetical protein [Candidatus Saccharimonadales bacterium]
MNQSDKTDAVYTLTFNDDGLYLNGRFLRKVQYDSMNYRFLAYMTDHANEVLAYADVVSAAELPARTAKKLPQVLNELGFKSWLRAMFFPITTGGKVMLRNPVTTDALQQMSLSPDTPVEALIKDANL